MNQFIYKLARKELEKRKKTRNGRPAPPFRLEMMKGVASKDVATELSDDESDTR